MQILFFLGLMGIIFTTMTFINTSVTVTAMQKKLDQVENVNTLFRDVEFAITKGILKSQADLSVQEDNGDLDNLLFVSGLVKWNDIELTNDPWGTEYQVITESDVLTIYADTEGVNGGNNTVNAYVTAFAIISAGPDGVFGNGDPNAPGFPATPFPNTFNGVRAYTPPNAGVGEAGEDDLYITFTTFASALEMWSHIKSVHDKVKSLAVNHYTEQMELFQPQIVNYYDNLDPSDIFDANGNYILDDDAWLIDLAAVNGFPQMAANLETLGATAEVAKLPDDFLNFSLLPIGVNNSELRLEFTNPAGGILNQWNVTYGNDVAGAALSIQ